MNTFQILCDGLCAKYHMDKIPVKLTSLDESVLGKFVKEDHIILVSDDTDYKAQIVTIYHEFRHYWQTVNYPELYSWWTSDEHTDFYIIFYFTPFCAIEEDARTFGYSLGNAGREDLLRKFTPRDLDQITDSWKNVSEIFEKNHWGIPTLQEIEEISHAVTFS